MNTSLEIIRSAGTDHLCYRVEKDTFVAVHNQMLSFTEMEDEFEIVPTDKSYRDKLYIYQGQAVRLVPQIYHNGTRWYTSICRLSSSIVRNRSIASISTYNVSDK